MSLTFESNTFVSSFTQCLAFQLLVLESRTIQPIRAKIWCEQPIRCNLELGHVMFPALFHPLPVFASVCDWVIAFFAITAFDSELTLVLVS